MQIDPAIDSVREKLTAIDQEQTLHFYDALDQEGKQKLYTQLQDLNTEEIKVLVEHYVKNKPAVDIPKNIESVKTYPYSPKGTHIKLYKEAEKRGQQLVKKGKVGAFLVAGGQGTRLGYNGPKGEYCVTPIKEKALFQVFAEQLLAYNTENKTRIPWYIMTSDANDAETKDFFKKNDYFGYNPGDILFFKQGMMPAFSMDGKLLLGEKDSLALSPDGHGGSLRAMAKSGALEDMKRRGVEHISYFQVDNPLVHCIDYRFIGLHDLAKSEMSSKTVPKAAALEKVGNFVSVDGKVQVIEYSDLPEELALQTNTDGSLKFNAGSIAIHMLSVSFIERLTANGNLRLPWHRAEKKVAYVNNAGEVVKPEKPNAVKLEQFIFDAIPLAKNSIVYETDRSEEFSPVKNAEGSDSPTTCRDHQVARAARWLEEAGIKVPLKDGKVAALLEIDPLFAVSAAQLKTRKLRMSEIPADAKVYFGPEGVEGLAPKQSKTRGVFKHLQKTIRRFTNPTREKTSDGMQPA